MKRPTYWILFAFLFVLTTGPNLPSTFGNDDFSANSLELGALVEKPCDLGV